MSLVYVDKAAQDNFTCLSTLSNFITSHWAVHVKLKMLAKFKMRNMNKE